MKKRIGIISGILAVVLALCCMGGCGRAAQEDDGDLHDEREDRQDSVDFTTEKWKLSGELEESDEKWAMTAYLSEFGEDSQEDGMIKTIDRHAVDGLDYYELEYCVRWGDMGEGYQKYYLAHIDMETMAYEKREILLSEAAGEQEGLSELLKELSADLNEGWAMIKGMDVQDGKTCLLVTQMDRESRTPSRCSAVLLDGDLKVESVVDLLPEMQKAGMCREDMVPEGILCGPEGYLYVGTLELGIFDRDGVFLKMVEAPGSPGGMILNTCRLPDGRPVFEYAGNGAEHPVLFYLEGLEEKILSEGKSSFAQTRFLNHRGEILYVGQGGLVRWNTATGKCERIFRDSSLNPMSCVSVAQISDSEVVMVFYEDEEPVLLKLEQNAEVEETLLTVWQLFDQKDLSEYVDEYSRKNLDVKIELVTVSEPGDDMNMAINRFMTKIVSEELPDLFWMPQEQLKILQDKGVLADLRELLPKELQDQIFPGVLQYCSEGDNLYGICITVGANTVLVAEDVWTEETWSFRDVMELAENREKEGGFDTIFNTQTYDKLLYDLVLRDIVCGSSSLVDEAGRDCSFDTEEFVKILEFCKKYGCSYDEIRNVSTSIEEQFEEEMEKMKNGKQLAVRVDGGLKNFSRVLAALGDGYRCIGFPTEGSSGNYLSCYRCIAVSEDSDNREAAEGFLEYLLGSRVQRKIGYDTVRKDVLINNVRDGSDNKQQDGPWRPEGPYFSLAGGATVSLEGRPDGRSFLPEYLEILEQAQPLSSNIDQLSMMIVQEAEAYFSGDKSAKDTADVIQNKVWLYLNEK